MFWFALALFAVSFVLQALLAPKPPKTTPGTQKPPRTNEGEPIPVVFGIQKVGPNCAWFGDVKTLPIRQSSGFLGLSKTTVGFNYEACLQAVICEGPVDELSDIVFDDTRYLSAVPAQPLFDTMVGASPTYSLTPSCSPALPALASGDGQKTAFTVWAPKLYRGNDAGGEGGTGGTIDFYWGSDAQDANDYLASANAQNQAVPTYKGLCYAVFRRSPGDEPYWWSNSPYLKTVYFVVRRNPSAANGPGTASVNGVSGDANAAEVLYEWLTNSRWGLGRSPAKLDLSSFQSAAQTLFDEGFGVAGTIHGDQDAASTMLDLLHHIDGVLYTHPTTGLFTLALIRDDYSRLPGGITVITSQNAHDISIAEPTPKERITECKVTYTSRTLDFTARSEGVQNAAANAKDVDRKIDLENFPYLTTPFTAQLAAARTLRAKSLPLRKASFKCSRAAFGFRIGAPFALECPEQGVDRAFFRVLTADYGTLEDGEMSVEAVEDVFSITGQTIVPSGGSGGTTTQIPSGGGLRLTIEEEWTDDGKMGTLELGIDDPGNVVTLVEFATQQGNGTKSAYATASGPPWQTSVLEVPKLPSYIFWRVTYTDADGSMQTTDGVHVFGAQATPDTPQISGAIDSIGNLNVAIRADALAAEVRVAASTSGVPSDATVDAATPIAGSSVSVASLLTGLAVGDVAYVAARGYGADGTPSNTGIATFTMGQGAITREDGSAAQPGDVVTIDASGDPVADPTLTPVDGFDFGFGNGSGALQANQHVGCRVPWNCTIDAWELYTEDGASASASVDIQKSSGVNPPSYGAVVGAGTKPNLSGAQWAQVTAITGWTTVALAAGDLLELTLTTVDGTVKTIRGFLSVTRT